MLTVVLGGGAAWMAGRSLAQGWRPIWLVAFYMALFAFAVRFFHYALGGGSLLSPHYYLADAAILIGSGLLSYQVARASQMVSQYPWLYRRTSPLTWTLRDGAVEP